MNFTDVIQKSKSHGLALCEEKLKSVKNAPSHDSCTWHEGRVHGILLTMY